MGNCLKAQNNDDISLLRGNDGQESADQAFGPPPPYQACMFFVCFGFTSMILFLYTVFSTTQYMLRLIYLTLLELSHLLNVLINREHNVNATQ